MTGIKGIWLDVADLVILALFFLFICFCIWVFIFGFPWSGEDPCPADALSCPIESSGDWWNENRTVSKIYVSLSGSGRLDPLCLMKKKGDEHADQ